MNENPLHALVDKVSQYAAEAGFSADEIHVNMDLFLRFTQLVAWGAEIELNKRFRQGPPEQTACLLDVSQGLEAKFLHGGGPSEEYKQYLENAP